MRGYARHFTSGVENVIREAELHEMERSWREENQRILAQYPADGDYPDPGPPPAEGDVPRVADGPVMTPSLPLEAPAAPDPDPTAPADRLLP